MARNGKAREHRSKVLVSSCGVSASTVMGRTSSRNASRSDLGVVTWLSGRAADGTSVEREALSASIGCSLVSTSTVMGTGSSADVLEVLPRRRAPSPSGALSSEVSHLQVIQRQTDDYW